MTDLPPSRALALRVLAETTVLARRHRDPDLHAALAALHERFANAAVLTPARAEEYDAIHAAALRLRVLLLS